jgi:hypothetical protein
MGMGMEHGAWGMEFGKRRQYSVVVAVSVFSKAKTA